MVPSLRSTKNLPQRKKVIFIKTLSIQLFKNTCVKAITWSSMRKLVRQAAMKPSRSFKLKLKKIIKMKTLKTLRNKNLKDNRTSNLVNRKFLLMMAIKMLPVGSKRRNLYVELALSKGSRIGLCVGVFMILSQDHHLKLSLIEISREMKQVCLLMPSKVKPQQLDKTSKIIVIQYKINFITNH